MNDSSEAIRNIFARVRQIPASERLEWLGVHCPDPMVRDQVLELLSYDRDDPFLDSPIDLLGLSAEAIARKLDEEHRIQSDESTSRTLSWDKSNRLWRIRRSSIATSCFRRLGREALESSIWLNNSSR